MATKTEIKFIKKRLVELLNKSTTRNIKVYHNTKTNVIRVEYQLCDIAIFECEQFTENELELKLIAIIETLLRIDKLIQEGRLK